ncbi:MULTISPECIES: hypothetical protein [Streptomyces]|uniref:hypothetical protein n=1 Tax=Streptomyces TaxID=1883 RepID=UPI0013BE4CBC|nr:hypothetical protein [Streptomyces sp. SID8014]NEC14228.1 hypothetical protein [Streptomyces sp. SID8014]
MSDRLSALADRVIRSGLDDVTASPLYEPFRLLFVRTYGREPGYRACWGGSVHELYDFSAAPDTF